MSQGNSCRVKPAETLLTAGLRYSRYEYWSPEVALCVTAKSPKQRRKPRYEFDLLNQHCDTTVDLNRSTQPWVEAVGSASSNPTLPPVPQVSKLDVRL
ncbi:hypothetical protein GT037_007047 [Alternaria burnsii]|uniref:Uncharacterized protein n=1 Tax=Alternaria burnsii TaxID=1187904 RepID=A0A8H7B141_9PLEO|nr:uncharacterized protein GT037_007047 [Alternaria burnsii]KAF7675284.1 hypothetical protein GT037_007047 [Alternaria burnsii]